jgi:cytochrome P450
MMDATAHSVGTLPDVQFVLRSKDFVPVRPESGFKAGYVARLTHDSLADLVGTAHFERRRLLSALFTRPRLQRYEDETLVPAVTAAIASARRPAPSGTAVTGTAVTGTAVTGTAVTGPVDLLVLCRRIFLGLAAVIIGLDGLEDLGGPRFARYNADFVQMERLARAKFIDDPEPLVAEALAAQERWRREYFQPSWDRRLLLRAAQANAGNPPAAPDDLISLIIGNRAHYEQWDPGLAAREATLFQNASVGSSAGAVCHAVEDLEHWFRERPQDRARSADPEFLRRALEDSLRLHANNVLIRTALTAAVLPSGIQVAAGEVVLLDRRAANAEIERASTARNGFGPDGGWHDQHPRYGLAFGGGAHTCIARPVVLGAAGPDATGPNRRHGLGVATLLALYAAGVRLDPGAPPERYTDMTRETFRTFPVRFASLPPDRAGAVAS